MQSHLHTLPLLAFKTVGYPLQEHTAHSTCRPGGPPGSLCQHRPPVAGPGPAQLPQVPRQRPQIRDGDLLPNGREHVWATQERHGHRAQLLTGGHPTHQCWGPSPASGPNTASAWHSSCCTSPWCPWASPCPVAPTPHSSAGCPCPNSSELPTLRTSSVTPPAALDRPAAPGVFSQAHKG